MAKSIDPHKIFSNLRNSDIENLSFSAELKVTRRARNVSLPDGDNTFTINFLGYSDENLFTTNWTEGGENFGIRSIDVEMTASYVPKILIEFIDVRGQAVYTDAHNSKYKCMFELPPPIFELTLKGYYGKPVSYRLHMVKQNTRWERGSYIIRAEFIGMTFAPLSDMMIDYLNVAPYLTNNLTDKSYVNFIKKTKKVVNQIEKEVNTFLEDISANEEKITKLESFKVNGTAVDVLEMMKQDIDMYINDSDSKLTYKTFLKTNNERRSLEIYARNYKGNDIGYFDKTKLEETYTDLQKYVGSVIGKYNEILPKDRTSSDFLLKSKIVIVDGIEKQTKDITEDDLNKNKGNLKSDMQKVFEFIIPSSFNTNSKIDNLIKTEKIAIESKKGKINESKKSIVISEGDLTLKNVLGIILENAKVFYNEIKSVVKTIEDKNRQGNSGKSNDLAKYAFPEFWGDKIENGVNKTVKMHPNGGDYDLWDENNFINRYIEAKKQVQIILNDINISTDNENSEERYISLTEEYKEFYKHDNIDKIVSDFLYRYTTIKKVFKNEVSSDGIDNEINLISQELLKKTRLGDVFIAKYENGYKEYINNLKKNIINDNPSTVINYSTQEKVFNFNKIVTNNTFFKNPNTTYNDFPIYIDEAYNKGNGLYDGNYDNKDDNFKDFLKDIFKNNIISIDKFCEIYLKHIDINFYNYFTYNFESVNTLKLLYDTIINDFLFDKNTYRGKGLYVIPRIYLIIFKYKEINRLKFNKYKLSDYPDLDDICTKEYNNFIKKSIVISGEMKLLTSADTFSIHENVAELFEPIFLVANTNNIYIKKEDYLSSIKEDIKYNVEELNTNLNKIKVKLLELRGTNNSPSGTAETRVNASIEQSELRTQLYYTFKSFVDKWIYSTPVDVDNMFSLENFLTVDRGFNDIGSNVIMDLSPLYNMEYSVDTSLYTLLLNLLGKNNINFFALPSYIDYNTDVMWSDDNIENVFGMFQPLTVKSSPKFICMYIGGVSSSLDIKMNNSFGSDSGSIDECIGLDSVHSFRVDIGSGNQSFFKDVELDQQEYKETNESILLLDEITRNNGNPNKIATNSLINIYEQRSYTATVPMMGCAMIQPTMYFELNVPMFKGTYLILEVRHNISNNSMNTSFKGVRMPKVSKPYVNSMLITTTSNNSDYISRDGYSESVSIASFFKDSTLVSNAKATIKERALLDMIAWAEGMDDYSKTRYLGYDIIIGGNTIPGWTPETPTKFPSKTGITSASGRYQMLTKNWNEDFGGKYKDLDFSITNQDNLALDLIRMKFKEHGNLNIENVTQNTFIKYVDALAPIWASLPFHNVDGYYGNGKRKITYKDWKPGLGLYGMDNGATSGRNQWNTKNTIQKLWEVFSESVKVGENKIVNLTGISKDNASILGRLHPKAQQIFSTFIRDIENNTDYMVILTSGYRTHKPQNSVYEPAEKSLHMVGLAIDLNLKNRKTNVQLYQDSSQASWRASGIENFTKKYGIYWGGNFSNPDKIHFELLAEDSKRFSGTILNDYKNHRQLVNLNSFSFQILTEINNGSLT